MQSMQQSIGASSQHSLGEDGKGVSSQRNTSLNNIAVPKLKSGIYKNAAFASAQKTSNGHIVSNQSGVQKKTFEYLTANMANEGHAQTLDDKPTKGDLGVGLHSKLQNKKDKNDMLTDYFSAKKKLGR